MPRGDRTGPLGDGPMTGRRMGFCAGYDMPGFAHRAGYAAGRGRGMARRRGCGGWGVMVDYPAPAPVAQPPDSNRLKGQIDALERSLAALKQQLEAMGKTGEE